MYDILFARVFCIVGAMLLITAFSAKMNTQAKGGIAIIIASFVMLFAVMIFANIFPINLVLVGVFSALIGWSIAPAIRSMGEQVKLKAFMSERGMRLKKGEKLSEQELEDFKNYLELHPGNESWNRIVSQAMFATAGAVFATASLVFVSDIDFGFMGMFLFIALLILIIMGFLNIFIFKSRIFSLVKAYFGVLIFTGYLIYDFNTLEKMAGDDSWGTAISIAVNLYLDIINLFLYILEILGDS